MHLVRNLRLHAVLCAVALLLCELLARPFANMGICDDWSYVFTAQRLAATGHIVYNGWATVMLGWQLYVGAACIRLFGSPWTSVRMGTLVVAMLTACVLQRALVRCGLNERNATLGTLTLALSPLYMMLSVSYMSDIYGLFAVVLCLYACLRALQAATSSSAVLWICFAVAANLVFGSARQIAWFGLLVMVPSTLWLRRRDRRVLRAGAAAAVLGGLSVLACMHWYSLQPYSIPEHILPESLPMPATFKRIVCLLLDLPFLLLPIMALFLGELRRMDRRVMAVLGLLSAAWLASWLVFHRVLLEPAIGDWITPSGTAFTFLSFGQPPLYLSTPVSAVFTFVSLGGLFCCLACWLRTRNMPAAKAVPQTISIHTLAVLTLPFAVAYVIMLVPRAAVVFDAVFDRYAFELLPIVIALLLRLYQDRVRAELPQLTMLLIAAMAVYAVASTHNLFALQRARVQLVRTIEAAGVADTAIDAGWEYKGWVELQHAPSINDPRIAVPANAYQPQPVPAADACAAYDFMRYPHIHPRYGLSFDPDACRGPAPFAPVSYSRGFAAPGTVYVVQYPAAR